MSKFIKDTIYTLNSRIVIQILGIIKSFIYPLMMNPFSFGLFRNMQLISNYFEYAHLGILSGMNLELPYLFGQDKNKEAQTIEGVAFWSSMIIAVVISFLIIIISFCLPYSKYISYYRSSLLILALALIFNQVFTFYNWSLRAEMRFKENAIGLSLKNALLVLLSIPLIYAYGPIGGIWGILIGSFGASLYFIRIKSFPKFLLSFQISLDLLIRGFPIIIIILFDLIARTLDQWLVVIMLGEQKLGIYALGIMIGNFIYFIPNTVTFTLLPRMLETYGRTNDVKQLKKYLLSPLLFNSLIAPYLIINVVIISTMIVNDFLVKYYEMLDILEYLNIYFFFYSLISIVTIFLVSIKNNKIIIYGLLIILIINFGLNYSLLIAGYGIKGVAIGTSISFIIYSIYMISNALTKVKVNYKFIFLLLVPFIFSYILYYLVIAKIILPNFNNIMGNIISLVAFTMGYFIFVRFMIIKLKSFKDFTEIQNMDIIIKIYKYLYIK